MISYPFQPINGFYSVIDRKKVLSEELLELQPSSNKKESHIWFFSQQVFWPLGSSATSKEQQYSKYLILVTQELVHEQLYVEIADVQKGLNELVIFGKVYG